MGKLLGRFNAFGHDIHAEVVRERDDRPNHF